VGNEEIEYAVLGPNKMRLNMSNELNHVHKRLLKEEIKNELIEILMKKHSEKIKQNVPKNSKNIKTLQIENLRRQRNN
jgi:hypothetical protein